MTKTITLLLITILLCSQSREQCTVLGQNPYSAFPVCGSQSFKQSIVPQCENRLLPGPCHDNVGESDLNPFWYKFTCFKTGTLGFVITPDNLNDDYDWQIFDVTGRAPSDVYTDVSLFVVCNWSSNPGTTGTNTASSSFINCAGPTFPNYSKMPNIIQGHDYLLLISHFTRTESGYKLDFGGGTAQITDTTVAAFTKATPLCGGTQISIKLNKKMECKSVDADGSDFMIPGFAGIISSAQGYNCSTGFDADSIIITLNKPLNPGNYKLVAQNGSDGNTLIDACAQPLAIGTSIDFTILPPHPSLITDITFPKCPPQIITLTFDQPLKCSSADPDGSDFLVTGPSTVNIVSVTTQCDVNGAANKVELHLAAPILTTGIYKIEIKNGNDQNTLIGICGDVVNPGVFAFNVPPTVYADFTYSILPSCAFDAITFSNNGGASINQWTWSANQVNFGNTPVVTKNFPTDSTYRIKLVVTNGGCTDIKDSTIKLDRTRSVFSLPDVGCPKDSVYVENFSTGNNITYLWDFGNGTSSSQKDPAPIFYPVINKEKIYSVSLKVTSPGCIDISSHKITILSSCFIDLPNSFTPNGDGLNDYFYPLNALKADNINFQVFNKWGQKIFESHNYKSKWDGTFHGQPQDSGIYVYIFSYTHHDTHKTFFKKGTVMLKR